MRKKYKLKTIPRIIAILLLIGLFIKIYTLLGYSSEWYELVGWMIELYILSIIYMLFEPLMKDYEGEEDE